MYLLNDPTYFSSYCQVELKECRKLTLEYELSVEFYNIIVPLQCYNL